MLCKSKSALVTHAHLTLLSITLDIETDLFLSQTNISLLSWVEKKRCKKGFFVESFALSGRKITRHRVKKGVDAAAVAFINFFINKCILINQADRSRPNMHLIKVWRQESLLINKHPTLLSWVGLKKSGSLMCGNSNFEVKP